MRILAIISFFYVRQRIQEIVAEKGLVFIDEGLDNRVYRNAEKTLVYRFPKQADVVNMLRKEAAILPILSAMEMGAQIPLATLCEYNDEVYATYPYVENVRYAELSLEDQRELIVRLSTYLSLQHDISDVTVALPEVDYIEKCQALLSSLNNTFGAVLNSEELTYAKDLFETYLSFEAVPKKILHGDMSFDHVFFSNNVLSIIDWSDLHMGDPAYEFYHLLRSCSDDEKASIQEHYKTADTSFWDRAALYMYLDTFFVLEIRLQKNNESLAASFLKRVSTDMADWYKRYM